MSEAIETRGGYIVLTENDGEWDVDVYTHWDNVVPQFSCVGHETREDALAAVDERGDCGEDSPRTLVSCYQDALEENCARLGIAVPPRQQPRV